MAKKIEVDPDDISKRMFRQAIEDAIARLGKVGQASMQSGVQYRTLNRWREGYMPSYDDMQKFYFVFQQL